MTIDLERTARAIYDVHGAPHEPTEFALGECYAEARAAALDLFQQMMEPADATVAAGREGIDNAFHGTKDVTFEQSIRECLQAMLKHMIAELK